MRSDLLDQARALDLSERIELVEAIWDTVDERLGADELAVPEAHQRQLDRRIAERESERAAGVPWDEARARLFRGR